MAEEQPRRRPRIPLSPTELYYFKELKKLKQAQKLEAFKASPFYKITNRVNIVLAGFMAYCLISILVLNYWQKTYVSSVNTGYGEIRQNKRNINELRIQTSSGNELVLVTNDLFDAPVLDQEIYLGKDFLCGRILKAKLAFDERPFWCHETYARFTVCLFALVIGLFVYLVNKHLTVNGLLVSLGLLFLASLYFVLV